MEDEHSNGVTNGGVLETGKADRSVWLMKCPLVVAKAWQSHSSSSSSSSSSLDSHPVAKVVLSIDPLRPDSSPEVLKFDFNIYAVTDSNNLAWFFPKLGG